MITCQSESSISGVVIVNFNPEFVVLMYSFIILIGGKRKDNDAPCKCMCNTIQVHYKSQTYEDKLTGL